MYIYTSVQETFLLPEGSVCTDLHKYGYIKNVHIFIYINISCELFRPFYCFYCLHASTQALFMALITHTVTILVVLRLNGVLKSYWLFLKTYRVPYIRVPLIHTYNIHRVPLTT